MKKRVSLSFCIKAIVLIWAIPSILGLIFINLTVSDDLRDQAARINQDMLELYMEQIDETLVNVDLYLVEMMNTNQNIVDLQLKTNRNERNLTKYALYQDLFSSTMNYPKMDGFFTYSTSDLVDDEFFNSVNTTDPYDSLILSEQRIQKKFLDKRAENDINTSEWFVWKMGDHYYLFRVVYDRNTYLGCWVSLDKLLKPLEKIDLEEGYSFFTSNYGQIMTENPTKKVMLDLEKKHVITYMEDSASQRYVQVCAASKSTDLYLVALISDNIILKDYRLLQIILIFMSTLIFSIIPIALVVVQRYLNHPLKQLTKTIEQVKDGDIEIRAEGDSSIEEMHILAYQFNDMMDEISQLKISVYEQKLKERETYLQYLQLQIHPHFFLNCMSLMHGLAELKKYKEIQQLSKSLVNYFRYMFKKASTLTSVSEEIQHVNNYMEIQLLRFPEKVSCKIEVDECLEDALIPPLSIQTFVENSIKYALDLTKKTEIRIKVEQLGDNMKVCISDNGKGFSIDVLKVINTDDKFVDEDDTHRIGIRNVKERLSLIFGNNCYIHFYNDHGSVVEYVIPVTKREGKHV